ncbi:PDR17 [Candida pseudojiufengensis]|uniref:PDR17 n=1 Tax=Candida pseudojiufengensis TaxID=497109 RepID=UPI00222592A8|nr:PDR17 [Candida pseudojiufengensis]KAI5964700.1 PDR17 [Candida pseudojiufengensis]
MFFLNKKNEEIDASTQNSESDISIPSKSTSITTLSSQTEDKVKTNLKRTTESHLPPEYPIKPVRRRKFNLTKEQSNKYNDILKHFESFIEKDIPINESVNAEKHPITNQEKAWLTKECFLRFLRASNWDLNATIKRMEETIIWRRSFGLVSIPNVIDSADLITSDTVSHENSSGKQLVYGYDSLESRPILILRNGYQNTKSGLGQVKHLVYMLESVIKFMPPGQDQIALLIDFGAAPKELNLSASFPSLSITKQSLHILQKSYPEILGVGLFHNLPWIANAFMKISRPFVDPYTMSKTHFDSFQNFVPKEQLFAEYEGDVEFKYDHELYWPKMNEIADKKYKVYMENFEKLGGTIGLSEYDLRLDETYLNGLLAREEVEL